MIAEVAKALAKCSGAVLQSYPHPVEDVKSAPCAIWQLEEVEYSHSFGGGATCTWSCTVVAGRVSMADSVAKLEKFIDPNGTAGTSVVAALQGSTTLSGTCQTLRVMPAAAIGSTPGEASYLVARLTVETFSIGTD